MKLLKGLCALLGFISLICFCCLDSEKWGTFFLVGIASLAVTVFIGATINYMESEQ